MTSTDGASPTVPLIAIRRSDVGRRTVLAVAGEVDMASTPDLGTAVDAAVESGASDLWIDLSATTFIDSTCVHLLLETSRRARGLQRRFVVVCPPGRVRRVFDIAGVAEALPLYDDIGPARDAG
jgi:anti-sigma B factor antagonist